MMRRWLRWLLLAFGLILIILVGAVALVQTGPGKRWLAAELSSLLSTPEAGVEISGVEGWIPLDMHVSRLRLADADGIWLSAHDVSFDWSPSALARGRIRIDEMAAERVVLNRLPAATGEPEPSTEEPLRLPEWPRSLPPITVERLAVPEIRLEAPVIGEAASFALEGSFKAADDGETVTARLDLERTDQPSAFATLEATAGLASRTFDLALNAGESGGLIAGLVDRPEIGEIELGLEGEGPLDAWDGQLHAHADGLARVEADLGLALVDQPRLTLGGSVEPAPKALPDDLAGLIGERLAVDVDLVQTDTQTLDLRKVALASEIANLDAKGSIGFDQGDLVLGADLAVPDLAPLGSLAAVALSGKASASLEVTGTLSAPDGRLELTLDGPAFQDKTAETITTEIGWTATAPLSSDRAAFAVAIDGKARGLVLPGTPLPDPDIAWTADLAAPLEGKVAIDHITIETAGSSLTARGAIDPAALDGSIDLALAAPSLQPLAEPYGLPLEGRALIEAAVRLADQANDVAVELDAALEDLEGLPPGAAELIGKKASLNAGVSLDDGTTLRLDELSIDGAGIALAGRGELDLDQKDIGGDFTLTLPDLAVLDAMIPEGAAGRLQLDADLDGTIDAPSAELRLASQDLVLAGEPVEKFSLALNGRDLVAAPRGDLQIDVDARKTSASLALAYKLGKDRLYLDAIDLRAPQTEIGGALAVLLDTTLVDGALEGRIADLGALEALTGQALTGSIELGATLIPDGERQNAAITLAGRDVGGAFGSLRTVEVDASLDDLLAEPGLDAEATLAGFEQGEATIDALTLALQGSGSNLDFSVDAAGNALKPFELSAVGSVNVEEGVTLGLQSLTGAFAGEPLRLAKPVAMRQAGDSIQLYDLDLRIGDAQLEGYIDIGDSDVEGAIDLRSLPLRWSEILGGPSISGVASADIDLSGRAADPKVVAALNADGLLAKKVAPGDLPLDITLSANLDQGRLAAELTGRGLTSKPITATASLPAKLALRPFAFDLPEDGELQGRIDAELLLARLADVLALDDQTMKGTLFADIDIGGTLGEPKIEGPIKLVGGGYENGGTGTDIRDLTLTATASNERIDVTELSGSTGKKGLIAAEGWLELDADADYPLSVTLSLEKARLVDRDDVEARISGDIAMNGDLDQAAITGKLEIDRAEISIPDGGGPNLPEIEVSEVGGRIVNPPEEEAQTGEERPFDPRLDINIALPNKVYVRGRGLDSEWQGDLQISGRLSEPIIVGSLEIKKGHFDFLDKRFELSLGEIAFSGSTPPNPILALEAVAEDDGFTAIIKLSGPADDPQLLLSSEPTLPEDEILARLLFNRQLSEIGPVEAGKLALAVNRLRGGGGFDAFGEIRDILKIDTLDVVSDEDGESRVKAGKYLNDDVYVEVEKGAGEESGRARVEIELLPNISLEADTSEDAKSGVGLKWKFDY